MKKAGWRAKDIDLLKQGWAKGLSASAIAKTLGGRFTRNAVLGKVHRLELGGRGPVAPVRKMKVATFPLIAPVRKREEPPEPAALRLPGGRTIATQDLQKCHCRWPHGDVGSIDFHYCGQPQKAGSPYCEAHATRAASRAQPVASDPATIKQQRAAERFFARMWGGR